ncbi:MAG: drug/metabolite exporter YedA [Byssovorax sp.]
MDMKTAPAPVALAPEARRKRAIVALALLSVYVVWGSTYLVMRIALETIPPYFMSGARFLLAGGLLYTFLRVRGAPRPSLRQWGAAGLVAGLLLVCGNGFIALAEQKVSSSIAAVVVATMPLWMALIGSVRGERPTPREWVGLLIGFAGVVVLNLGGELGHAGLPVLLLLLLAPITWALGSVWSKRLPLPEGPMATAAEMLVGGAAMLVLGVAQGHHPALPSLRSGLAVGYLVVFGSIIAFSAYGYLLRNTRPAIATSYAYVNPVIAVALGALVGHEPVGLLTCGATAIVLTGVVILTRARQRAS